MRVSLVTGGAGFIGSHLVEALVKRGDTVRVLDNLSTGTLSNLAAVQDKIELIQGDVSDPDLLRTATKGVDIVFHQAPPAFSHDQPDDANAIGWACATDVLRVLIAAHEARVKRVVYASSASVYGNRTLPGRLSETDAPAPASPYAFAKLTGEQHCSAFTSAHGLETVRLRYFNVFGPRQPTSSPCGQVISIVKAMLAGQNPVLEGDSRGVRDLTYVDDVVHANLLAAETPRTAGKVYNIARGRPTTLLDVVTTVNAILGTHLEPTPATEVVPRLQYGLADVSRAEAELGFCASTDLEQGLRLCIAETSPAWANLRRAGMPHDPTAKGPHLRPTATTPPASIGAPPAPGSDQA